MEEIATTNTGASSNTSGMFDWSGLASTIVSTAGTTLSSIFGGKSESAQAQAYAAQYSYQESKDRTLLLWGLLAVVVIIVLVFAFAKTGRK